MSTPVRCAVTAIFVLGSGANAIADDGAALYRAHCAICHGDVTARRGSSADLSMT